MKRVAKILVLPLLVILAAGCCMKFNDVTVGDTYNVGDRFMDRDIEVKVERFQYGNGEWTEAGRAEVDDRNLAMHKGNDINCRNVNLHFLFRYPCTRITLRFGDYGGNINITVNGDQRNVGGIELLDNTTVGGVDIKLDAEFDGHNWKGKMTLEGMIQDFKIGGQELWIDKVCRDH